MHHQRKGVRWYHWYAATDSPEDRKLLLKLDLLLLPYAFAMFWMYYVDATNISNAWVSGLATDLDLHGDELVQLTSLSQGASIIGTVPFAYLFTRVPMHYLVPGLQVGWGVFTLLQFRGNSYGAFLAFRFFVGLFEGPFYVAVQYVLGSWYRPDEFGRRGALFWCGLPLGGLTAGLIQSATSDNIHNVGGLAGWRWMFIVVGTMSIAIGIIGFFLWPGTPDLPNRLVVNDAEITAARTRLEKIGFGRDNDLTPTFSWKLFKYTFGRPIIYLVVIWQVIFWNADAQNWSGYILWLNSLGRYTTGEVNRLSMTAPALSIIYAFLIPFASDLWLGRTAAILIANAFNIMAMTILVIWDVPESAKWFAFNLQYCVIILASVIYGWANDLTRYNKQERALILCIMQIVPSSVRAWIGLLVFRTEEAPRFRKGWAFVLANSVLFVGWTFVVRWFWIRQE